MIRMGMGDHVPFVLLALNGGDEPLTRALQAKVATLRRYGLRACLANDLHACMHPASEHARLHTDGGPSGLHTDDEPSSDVSSSDVPLPSIFRPLPIGVVASHGGNLTLAVGHMEVT